MTLQVKPDSGTVCLSSQFLWSRTSDFLELTKPRLTALVLFTTFVGFCLGMPDPAPLLVLINTLIGTALIAGGAGALNMYSERVRDALMKRTSRRPLAAGRLKTLHGLLFALLLSIAGFVYLTVLVNPLPGLVSAAIVASYLFLYTPLKTKTWTAALVGAVPGALPIVMGWTAAGAGFSSGAWILFSIMYLWQIPHFYAIAWIHREDYARAGLPVLSVVDSTGRRTSRQGLVAIALLTAASFAPAVTGMAGPGYAVGAAALAALFLFNAVRFARRHDYLTARRLFIFSAIYLPSLLMLLVISAHW